MNDDEKKEMIEQIIRQKEREELYNALQSKDVEQLKAVLEATKASIELKKQGVEDDASTIN